MCYNPTVSLTAFLVGVMFSLLLIGYGNPRHKAENMVFGVLLLFVAGIQFMEFLFWVDLHNKIGVNKLATVIGSLFNMGQPLLIYIIKVVYYNAFQVDWVAGMNFLYLLYLLRVYYQFIVGGTLTTSKLAGRHLRWPWLKYINPWAFIIMFATNIFYLTDFTYSFVMFSIVYCILAFASTFFPNHVGEFWCFLSTSVPALMLPLSYYIDKLV